ncbi:MAG: hypothetical protein V4577_31745 [Bacteroidota bacterium]
MLCYSRQPRYALILREALGAGPVSLLSGLGRVGCAGNGHGGYLAYGALVATVRRPLPDILAPGGEYEIFDLNFN